MIEDHILLSLGWILFCVLHSLFAHISVKQKMAQVMGAAFQRYRLYYTLFSFLTFVLIVEYEVKLNSFFIYRPTVFSTIVGWLVGISGLLIMAICIYKYFGQLSGLKTLFTNEVKTGNTLIITGIHQYMRHPLYTGTFLFIWGLFIFLPYTSILISNFIITIYTLIGIQFEEDKLIREFGEPYQKYRKQVPKIIPFVKPSAAN